MTKKVLVTGADGFIGSHLVEELVRQGYEVKAFVMYNSFNTWGWLETIADDIKSSIEIFSGDIRDPFSVQKAMEGCNSVFHLAALIAIPYSYYAPDAYVDVNVRGTLNILQAARDLNFEKVIHTSTSEVYGSAQYVPIDELHPIKAQSPYSASKIAADQLAYSFYASFNLPVLIIRPFNTYGPRQSARAVIPSIITQIASGLELLRLGALEPTRDFSYVEDTVSGFISAFKSHNFSGDIINLGSGFEISVGNTAVLIKEIMQSDIEIISDSNRIRPESSEVNRLFSSNKKAIDILKWTPHYGGLNGFKKGLIKTIDWYCSSDNIKKYKSDIFNI